MIIAIDFDGTVVEHRYPEIGKPVPYAIPVMKALNEQGHKLILYTMRSDEHLDDAVQYLKDNDIELWGVNENPEQTEWTNSPKVYAQMYIDDAALGCPLRPGIQGDRPMVDWGNLFDKLVLKKEGNIMT